MIYKTFNMEHPNNLISVVWYSLYVAVLLMGQKSL